MALLPVLFAGRFEEVGSGTNDICVDCILDLFDADEDQHCVVVVVASSGISWDGK